MYKNNNDGLIQKYNRNKSYSKKLLAVIIFTALAGISIRISMGNFLNNKPSDNSVQVATQSEDKSEQNEPGSLPPPISGTGSMLTGSGSELSGSGSHIGQDGMIEEGTPAAVACGYMDDNQDGRLDNTDFESFKTVYLKYCKLQNPREGNSCGLKDADNDRYLTIADFIKFGEMYKQGTCNSKRN